MATLPSKYIIDSSAISFEQQPPFTFCGHYQIKAMLDHYTQKTVDYADCCRTLFARYIGLMHPHELTSSLNYHGLPSKHMFAAEQTPQAKINLLKRRLLKTEGPHVIMLARLYDKQGTFQDTWMRRVLYHHYVSVRGYDDDAQRIYLYDSTNTVFPDNDQLPTGNFSLPYEYFLHCRKRGGMQLHNFSLVTILPN